MKRFIIITGLIIFIFSCSVKKQTVKIEGTNAEVADQDSVEYVLETFDQKFETWYMLHNSPSQYRSQQYYEGWNRQYVSAWNYHATDPRRSSFFESIVGYEATVDYGFELNHKLFYYFQYVENV
ncbi:MAG: DUF6146 family protein, partial [Prolixibacteraceae bacterium]|nr:DUF6146 family protein [Prolixibacteraceae bacterium]